jgi:alpha amylase-like protein
MAESAWWMHGIVYEIYPRSFQDSNEDGVGDLQGIRQRLDYLTWLGVDAIWIAPIHPSPMADFGYDVSDYCGVDPLFGSLSDFDDLLRDAHSRGLKVILDFVPNLRSTPLVQGKPIIEIKSKKRLVYLAQRQVRWRAAEQLGIPIWWFGLDIRCEYGTILSTQFFARAARPELAQPRCSSCHV